MSDFAVTRIDGIVPDDKTWAASKHGFGTGRSVTLDVTAFTRATHYPNGFIPSGTPVTEDAVSGLFEPTAADGKYDGILLEPVTIREPGLGAAQTKATASVIDHGIIFASRLRGAAAGITPADDTQFVIR